ncbi:hypothetical protein [Bosea sp. (in: a-proteobacteria)]|uniref:hypothetical protein n=1 Tax=Bosea sp. (in: a-proteobacteria) TaxID=1871050 RepID=UPI0025BDE4C3|nr:hypothetical protein [Bosea sp. (in: a-proteobacteria)]
MMRLLVVLVVWTSAGSAVAQDQNRRVFAPTVRAATECATRVVVAQGTTVAATDEAIREGARRAFGSQCRAEGLLLVSEHDRLYGAGTGRSFVDGPYFADFPRAARVRMNAPGGLTVTVSKPVRCPDMLEIHEVQDAGRDFAGVEQDDLLRNPKTDVDVLASFTRRMDARLSQARHVMARPVLEEFRRLPPMAMEACFPALRPVLASARLVAAQLEAQRIEMERQRADAERVRIEAEQRRIEEQRIADLRRADELRLAELRRAEMQRAEEDRRRAAEEEAARKRAEAQRAEEERQRELRRPVNVLKRSYAHYAFVKQCFEFRSGYVSIFVSENEFGRARIAIKAIETKLKSLDGSINTDFAWAEAASSISIVPERNTCQTALQLLMAAFQEIAPDAATPKKDF